VDLFFAHSFLFGRKAACGTNLSSVVYNTDGSIRSLNGFGSITGTNNVGREYDERYIRLGVRLSF
jgi:hypothetical protein